MRMHFDIERLIHSLKTAFACVVALLLVKLIGLSADQWIVITVIVVMCAQIYVGSVLQKAYLRFLGTLIGCLLASIALLTFGDTNLAIYTSIALSSFIFSYLATGQESLIYMGTLGAVTTTIIMLGQHPTILFALQRLLEISIGIFIATVISQYILPIRARTHLRRAQAETLRQLQEFYNTTMVAHSVDTETNHTDLDEAIIKTLLRQRQLAKDSKREPGVLAFNTEYFLQTLYYEREILRAIWSMHDAYIRITNAEDILTPLPELNTFHTTIGQMFTTLIQMVESNTPLSQPIALPDLTSLRAAMPEQTIYTNGFIFSAEILTHTLEKLTALFQARLLAIASPLDASRHA